jgi:hypothetical protein
MNRRMMVIGVVLALFAIVPFVTWPFWKSLLAKPVSVALFENTKALVERNPPLLQPLWDEAMRDDVLTWSEAKEIWDKAGQKMDPER